jgi:hypothetical protein
MSDALMILPSRDCTDIRLVRIPDEFEKHEVFRHVTGLTRTTAGKRSPQYWKTTASNLWTLSSGRRWIKRAAGLRPLTG